MLVAHISRISQVTLTRVTAPLSAVVKALESMKFALET
jgi:hypothetical protein